MCGAYNTPAEWEQLLDELARMKTVAAVLPETVDAATEPTVRRIAGSLASFKNEDRARILEAVADILLQVDRR